MIPGCTVTVHDFGGSCPVQGYGTIRRDDAELFNIFAERQWYFRARGQHWSVTVGTGDGEYVPPEGADLDVHGPCDDVRPYSAGYMEQEECDRHLVDALTRWANGERGTIVLPDPPDMLPPCMDCGKATARRVRQFPVCDEHAARWEAALLHAPNPGAAGGEHK